MPNIKSAIKRVKVARTKTLQNTMTKSALKTSIRKCRESIESKSTNVTESFKDAVKTIDKAAAKNLIHKNTAARRKSKLAKLVNIANATK